MCKSNCSSQSVRKTSYLQRIYSSTVIGYTTTSTTVILNGHRLNGILLKLN